MRTSPDLQTGLCVQSLVKLFSIDDSYFVPTMAKVEKLLTDSRKDEIPKKVEQTKLHRN